ncbi:MAG TPA: adenylate cyclase regulatory domain-containing protein [Solirubrobacterales bacterium]|nr:adenylate cyclase regulatory domain-containing protein [Solirubrobacterales bacterium]
MADQRISLSEAARRSGVPASTLKRWAEEKIVPVRKGRWTATAAAQARVVARMRERGYSLEDLKNAGREGRLAFGFAEELFSGSQETFTVEEVAEQTGLEPELVERILVILGTPTGQRQLTMEDAAALRHCSRVLAAGFPLVAFLQLVRVYAQSMRRIADAEVRLFHLYVHEPLTRDAVPELEMAEEMGDLAADILPLAAPLTEYLHQRYLRFFVEQDVVGHMEADSAALETAEIELGHVHVTLCFIDLTGFTRYTEEEGDIEALDVVENFVATVEATMPREATIVKTIGDEVMVVSPDPASLTEWAVGFLSRFPQRPQPRVGIHFGDAVYRDGDYFGSQVNLVHRVVNRALAGEVLVTGPVAEAVAASQLLELEPIGAVSLKGFPRPTELFVVRAA